ncbi:MAG: pepsin-like aspartic protease [Acidobacteriaceae bacterium]
MSTAAVRLPITNVHADGDYTGLIRIGSQKTDLNVLLDTGSGTLAIDGTVYNVKKDKSGMTTQLAQDVEYVDNTGWIGGVVMTDVTVGSRPITLKKVAVAVSYHETKNIFGNAHGILGLAYKGVNKAFTMPGPTIPPRFTFNQIQAGRVTYLEPYFTQLEEAGCVANKFAFYTKRSEISRATAKPAEDPLNQGFLILGGGEEQKDLYTGKFQVARVVHDFFYNTNLKSIIVGDAAPISVSPPTKASRNPSNSIIDSGTNRILLDQALFDALTAKLSSAADDTLSDAIQARQIPMSRLDLASWPTITFVLEGALGSDVELRVSPETYWQTNAPKRGLAKATILTGAPTGQCILGLPLLNNYYTVFDRSMSKGVGVVSFAKIK